MIYKFVDSAALHDATHFYYGWGSEAKSGIIQFYSPTQIIEIAVPQFSGFSNLLLVEIDELAYGGWIQWESLGSTELFPRLHCPMDMNSIISSIGLFDDDETRISLLQDYIFENPDIYPRRQSKWKI